MRYALCFWTFEFFDLDPPHFLLISPFSRLFASSFFSFIHGDHTILAGRLQGFEGNLFDAGFGGIDLIGELFDQGFLVFDLGPEGFYSLIS